MDVENLRMMSRCERCGTQGFYTHADHSVCGQIVCGHCRQVGEWTVDRSPDELAEILMNALDKKRTPCYSYWLENTVEKWCKNATVIARARDMLFQIEREETEVCDG